MTRQKPHSPQRGRLGWSGLGWLWIARRRRCPRAQTRASYLAGLGHRPGALETCGPASPHEGSESAPLPFPPSLKSTPRCHGHGLSIIVSCSAAWRSHSYPQKSIVTGAGERAGPSIVGSSGGCVHGSPPLPDGAQVNPLRRWCWVGNGQQSVASHPAAPNTRMGIGDGITAVCSVSGSLVLIRGLYTQRRRGRRGGRSYVTPATM
eukprot:362975-Chlamydomonas_euryale.AAC.4